MVILNALEASKVGDLETLKRIEHDKQSLVDSNGASCLHYASRGGSVHVIEYLIKSAGFSVQQRSKSGATALHDAAAKGNTAVVKWLVENTELNVNDQDNAGATALHLAARFRHILTVEWLLDEAEASAAIRTTTDALPLHFAVVGGDMNCVKILVDENPRLINMQMNNGTTPVYLACQAGYLDILKYLVSKNGATKIKAYDAMSCLHAAAQMGHLEVVKWLVKEEKCNPNDRDFDGATPLHYAASRGHAQLVHWLLKEGGAKVTLDNLGGSPLHNAAELGEVQTVVALLQAGCDVSLVDNEGLTAAELADKCGQTGVAALVRGEVTLEHLIHQQSTNKTSHQLRSPHIRFPPPPPFPPDDPETGVASTSKNLPGTSSPPLPPPPLPVSPPTSTPSTQGSPISPPTPISEIEDETITSLQTSFEHRHSHSSHFDAKSREPIKRTVSRISVDSTASNFGVFEQQEGAVIQTVKADVHPRPVSYNSGPGDSTHKPTQGRVLSAGNSSTSLTSHPGGSLGYQKPGVVNIYSKKPKTTAVEHQRLSLQSSGSPLSVSTASLHSDISTASSDVVTVRPTQLNISPDVKPSSSTTEKKVRKPYYSTQHKEDFNTLTKTSFAKAKALFQDTPEYKSQDTPEYKSQDTPEYKSQDTPEYKSHICPDSGELCYPDPHSLAAQQHKRLSSRMEPETTAPPPPPPPLPLPENNHLTNGAQKPEDVIKSVVNIHGGHVTIISTGTKPNGTNTGEAVNNTRPVSGVKASATPLVKASATPLVLPAKSSDPVSALMKELSVRNKTLTNGDSPDGQLVNGHSSQSGQVSASMVRPASVHAGLGISANRNGDIQSSKVYSRSSSSSSVGSSVGSGSQPRTPEESKHNLIADIQSAVSGSSNLSLRRAKVRGEGVSMVYQSKKGGGGPGEAKNDHRPLTGDFDPKNFLDKVEKVDATGLVIPEWRRQVLAKHAAEKAQKEFEERKTVEDYEERFRNVPAWKRALIERKEAQAKEEAAASKK